MIYIVHGPAGCGKTTHAAKITEMLTGDPTRFVDEGNAPPQWPPREWEDDMVYLCCTAPRKAPPAAVIDYFAIGLPDLRPQGLL